MRVKILHIVLASILLLNGKYSFAQLDSNDSVFSYESTNDLILPSLDSAIQMAIRNNLLLRSQELVIEQRKTKYEVDKKLIQRALTFNSQYSYGNNSAVINNQLMNGVPYTAATASNFYSAGIFLNISAFQITARKKQLRLSQLDIELATEQFKQIQIRITQEVKQRYIELIKQRNIFQLRLEAVSSAKLAKEFAERDFQSGSKAMEALSNANEAFIKLSIAKEQSYAAYLMALYEFETLIGKK